MAYRAEREIPKIPGGFQDHVVCSIGGFKKYVFGSNLSISSSEIDLDQSFKLQFLDSLLLVHTGENRNDTKVLEDQMERNKKGENDLLLTNQQILTKDFEKALEEKDIKQIGAVLDASWSYKKLLGKNVSNSNVDEIYSKLRSCGALGGKLLGAGGGGTLLILAEEEKRRKIFSTIDSLKLNYSNFTLEESGAKVL
jgi:D-glycero-alpha-D-manno-heptose-7-phosphate kinase